MIMKNQIKSVLLIADMDGCTNIWRRLQTFQGTNSWKEARYDYLDDVNAAINGIELALEDPLIYLIDVHEEGYNFPKPPSGRNLIYQPGIQVGELPFFKAYPQPQAAIYMGFHVGPGEKGFAAYLFKPKFKEITVNGEKWGEFEYFNQLLAVRKTPLYMVAGTEEITARARKKFPGITTLTVSKDPETYRGNVATRRYIMQVWEQYREKIGEAFRGGGYEIEPVEEGKLVITFKDQYRAWCIDSARCSREGQTVVYEFSDPVSPLFIIFYHAYFDGNISLKLGRLKLSWQNFVRNLKSRGILKGF